jgi:mRNA-capping enzyme
VVGLGIACNGKYIMSCSEKNELVVWDLKGEQLAKVDTYLMTTICAQISPCARFIVASGRSLVFCCRVHQMARNVNKGT